MSTTEHREPAVVLTVVLDPDQVETLRHLLGTVEDWLLHCSDDAFDDLAGFLAGRGWASAAAPRQLASNLRSDLGDHAVALRTALRAAGIASGPTA